jgi:hypothetical protein
MEKITKGTVGTVTKAFTITTSPEVLARFEKFLCFLHYNGGHSGVFAMSFDGDGPERFKVEPAPDKGTRDWSRISDAGASVEVAYNKGCVGLPVDRDRARYKCDGKTLVRVNSDDTEEVCRTYDT